MFKKTLITLQRNLSRRGHDINNVEFQWLEQRIRDYEKDGVNVVVLY